MATTDSGRARKQRVTRTRRRPYEPVQKEEVVQKEAKPEVETKPVETEKKPAEAVKKPVEAVKKPVETVKKPTVEIKKPKVEAVKKSKAKERTNAVSAEVTSDEYFLVKVKSEEQRFKEAHDVVKNHAYMALGSGLIPFPLIDTLAVTGVQVRMIQQLCSTYEVKVSENVVKTVVASLVGGLNTGIVGGAIMGSLIKLLPGIGLTMGMSSMAAISSATTYAVGRVFLQHFEGGGTFLDFNPNEAREYLHSQYQEGLSRAKGA